DPSNDSFVNKAGKHPSTIVRTTATLLWADGGTSVGEVGADGVESNGLIKYLPQKAVEALCSPANNDELIRQIENVIFQALDETARLGTSDFSELKDNILTGHRFERSEIVKDIKALNAQYYSLDNAIRGIPAKKQDLVAKSKELEKL